MASESISSLDQAIARAEREALSASALQRDALKALQRLERRAGGTRGGSEVPASELPRSRSGLWTVKETPVEEELHGGKLLEATFHPDQLHELQVPRTPTTAEQTALDGATVLTAVASRGEMDPSPTDLASVRRRVLVDGSSHGAPSTPAAPSSTGSDVGTHHTFSCRSLTAFEMGMHRSLSCRSLPAYQASTHRSFSSRSMSTGHLDMLADEERWTEEDEVQRLRLLELCQLPQVADFDMARSLARTHEEHDTLDRAESDWLETERCGGEWLRGADWLKGWWGLEWSGLAVGWLLAGGIEGHLAAEGPGVCAGSGWGRGTVAQGGAGPCAVPRRAVCASGGGRLRAFEPLRVQTFESLRIRSRSPSHATTRRWPSKALPHPRHRRRILWFQHYLTELHMDHAAALVVTPVEKAKLLRARATRQRGAMALAKALPCLRCKPATGLSGSEEVCLLLHSCPSEACHHAHALAFYPSKACHHAHALAFYPSEACHHAHALDSCLSEACHHYPSHPAPHLHFAGLASRNAPTLSPWP